MNRIRDLREDADLRQADVAAAVGIDQRTLSNYETGKTNPDSFAILKLANFFHVSTDYLLGNDIDNSKDALLKHIRRIETELASLKEDIQKW